MKMLFLGLKLNTNSSKLKFYQLNKFTIIKFAIFNNETFVQKSSIHIVNKV